MPVVVYSLLRFALFVVCTVVLVLVGTGWLLGVIIGAVVAALLSYLLLSGPRERSAHWLQARAQVRGQRPKLPRRAQEDAEAEDAEVAGQDGPTAGPADPGVIAPESAAGTSKGTRVPDTRPGASRRTG